MATRCSTVDQFVATFHRFCDDETFFVATLAMRPVGLETAFSIQLADRTPVLRGLCVVHETWTTASNTYGRPGIRLKIVRLTRESTEVFTRLRAFQVSTAPVAITTIVTAPYGQPFSGKPAATATPAMPRAMPPVPAIPPVGGSSPPASASPASASPATSSPPLVPASIPPTIPQLIRPRAKPQRPLTPDIATVTSGEINKRPITQPTIEVSPELATEPEGLSTVRHAEAQSEELPTVAVRAEAQSEELPTVAVRQEAPSEELPTVAVRHSVDGQEVESDELGATRTPGSEYVLPANPLMNLTDESLEGFVDCTLYEDTGMFPLDETTPVPERRPTIDIPPIEPPLPSPTMMGDAIEPPPERSRVAGDAEHARPAAIEPPVAPPVATSFDTSFETPALGAPQAVALPERVAPRDPPPSVEPVAVRAIPIAPPIPRVASPVARGVPARKALRWWIVAVPSVLVVLAVGIVLVATRSTASSDAPAPDRTPVTTPLAAPPEPPPKAEVPKVVTPKDFDTEPVPGAPPIVGKGPCRITILATPAGTQIQIDGEAIGPAPLSFDGPCQKRRVDLSHARYAAAMRWVTPEAGKPESVDVTLARPTHSLTVVTQPAGATVSIDGRRAGTSPTVVKIMGFQTMSVTVEKPGFQPVTRRVYSKQPADKLTVTLPVSLFPPKRR